ncbi:MAG TPA: cupin domain-containing protein [Caulobacteraceae bacterium]|nr:cupin domain-containing protein [Caulobacteraceae bacterium]
MSQFKLSILAWSAAALVGSTTLATHAWADGCPAGQMHDGARTSGETMPKGVTDTELNSLKLGDQIVGLDGRRLRLRKLVIQPGGVVPWHSHGDRPALIMTLSGSITEYRSTCAVGIEHPAGDVAREETGYSHWWKNNGKVPAVLLAADIKNDGAAPDGDHM